MPDLNAHDVEAAMQIIAGTARSMGVEVEADERRTASATRARAAQIDRERDVLAARGDPAAQGASTARSSTRRSRSHFRLGLNVRHADQQLRGTLMLPHGTGKDVRVAVFAEGEKAKEAEEAGADVVGAADLAKRDRGAASPTSTSRSRRRT